MDEPASGSIFFRLLTAIFLLLVIQAAIATAAVMYFLNNALNASERSAPLSAIEMLGQSIELIPKRDFTLERIALLIRPLKAANPLLKVYLLNQDGLCISDFGGAGNLPGPEITDAVKRYGATRDIAILQEAAKDGVLTPIRVLNSESYYLYTPAIANIFQRMHNVFTANILGKTFFLVVFLSSICVGGLGALLLHFLTRPLRIIASRMSAYRKGESAVRITSFGVRETDAIALAFNSMAESINGNIKRLAQKDRQRRDLMLGVTHDLGSPVTAIYGFSEMLLQNASSPADVQKDQLGIILRNAQLLRELLSELTELAQIEEAALRCTPSEFSIAELIREVLAGIRSRMGTRRLTEPSENESSDVIIADRVLIERVLVNLLENALRHTPEHGEIGVTLSSRSNGITVSVSNSGPAIPQELQDKIFTQFFQARGGQPGSLGLGLTIVQRILDAHGQAITVQSTPESGTTFAFTLPLSQSTYLHRAAGL